MPNCQRSKRGNTESNELDDLVLTLPARKLSSPLIRFADDLTEVKEIPSLQNPLEFNSKGQPLKNMWVCICSDKVCQDKWNIIKDAIIHPKEAIFDSKKAELKRHNKMNMYKEYEETKARNARNASVKKQKITNVEVEDEDEYENNENVNILTQPEQEQNKEEEEYEQQFYKEQKAGDFSSDDDCQDNSNRNPFFGQASVVFEHKWRLYHCDRCHTISFGRKSYMCRNCKVWRCNQCIRFNIVSSLIDISEHDQYFLKNTPLCEVCLTKYYKTYIEILETKQNQFQTEILIFTNEIRLLQNKKPTSQTLSQILAPPTSQTTTQPEEETSTITKSTT